MHLLLLLALLFGLACSPATDATSDDAEYVAEIERWRAERLASLTAEGGWLTLVGLFWLEAGSNSFGAAPSNDFVLPELPALAGLPDTLGVFHEVEGEVTVEAAAEVPLTSDGAPFNRMPLRADTSGDPTRFALGTLDFTLIERAGRHGVRVRDHASPARGSFAGLNSFPTDPRWRLTARFEPYTPVRTLSVATVLPWAAEMPTPGAVSFAIAGTTYRLDAFADSVEAPLFLIFGDETNGKESYGGGRYLYTDPPAADGSVVVDFNRAYSPPCLFTPYATCPLPPPQNRLPVRITAGEKSETVDH